LKERLKQFLFGLLHKDPEAIVVSFATGEPADVARMYDEVRTLEPERRHVLVTPEELTPGSAFQLYQQLRELFKTNRIGLAPLLLNGDKRYRPLRWAAFLLAPRKILAYNKRFERHHLRLSTAIASVLFLRGVPLDRIFLRPKWLAPWKRDRSVYPKEVQEYAGRALSGRPQIAVLSPYYPYPFSHGGAVRIFHLLREMSHHFDIWLLAFRDQETAEDLAPVQELCAGVKLVGKPRYREPRWSTLLPPEVHEFDSPAMHGALERLRKEYRIDAVQVEYTFLAPYAGDVLVEHDVTFELYRQVWERERSLSALWDYWRWRRFEKEGVARYRRVVAMSEQDRAVLGSANVTVLANGVDLYRFWPEMERFGQQLLFIGSFRHFPNIVAFRFFVEQVWPLLRGGWPDMRLTVVAGPDPLLYWTQYTGLLALPAEERIEILGFVADVRPLYIEANVVLAPTLVSAGTNLKVLEAMAMDRAVVSTSSGCQGLGLEHRRNVWIADTAKDFAAGIATLLSDDDLRHRIAAAGRAHVERNFDWKQIGAHQKAMLDEVIGADRVAIRPVVGDDIDRIFAIQATAPEASQWNADDYLAFNTHVAVMGGRIAGFLVSRLIGEGEREILNVAVDPAYRRRGIARQLIREEVARWPGTHFLEVRESNAPARRLYESLGFEQVGERPSYYENPTETGIVMRIFS
jgi:ribosomal protein S18 acetylase RimI-like enzyme/glycosyltransferase involved in cell wall biosynthesis